MEFAALVVRAVACSLEALRDSMRKGSAAPTSHSPVKNDGLIPWTGWLAAQVRSRFLGDFHDWVALQTLTS